MRLILAVLLLLLAAGWSLHGLSLGLVLYAVGVPFELVQWPFWTGAAALATAIGFLAVFAPGGLGVREGLLIEFLAAHYGVPKRCVRITAGLRSRHKRVVIDA